MRKEQSAIFAGPSTQRDTSLDRPIDDESIDTPVKEIEDLFVKLESYSKTTFELVKFQSLKVTSNIAATFVFRSAVVIMIALFLLFLSFGVSLWLGDLLGKSYYGFYVVAGAYLLIALVCHLFLYPIIRRAISQAIIAQALD